MVKRQVSSNPLTECESQGRVVCAAPCFSVRSHQKPATLTPNALWKQSLPEDWTRRYVGSKSQISTTMGDTNGTSNVLDLGAVPRQHSNCDRFVG
jgi:hypothetical protein